MQKGRPIFTLSTYVNRKIYNNNSIVTFYIANDVIYNVTSFVQELDFLQGLLRREMCKQQTFYVCLLSLCLKRVDVLNISSVEYTAQIQSELQTVDTEKNS